MSEEILDGTGKGFLAKVNSQNRLFVDAVSQSTEHSANFDNGQSFNLVVQQTPTGAGDYFIYLKNNGTDPVVVEGISYRVASAETVLIYSNVSGTPASGTAITNANLNTGSSKILTGVYEAGNDITGLSGGNLIYRLFLTSTETNNYNFDQDVVIEQGGNIAFVASAGSIQLDVTVFAYIGST